MLNFEKLGLIFKPVNDIQEHILTRLCHALPCIIEKDNDFRKCFFFDQDEAELFRENAIDEQIDFIGYFNPMTA